MLLTTCCTHWTIFFCGVSTSCRCEENGQGAVSKRTQNRRRSAKRGKIPTAAISNGIRLSVSLTFFYLQHECLSFFFVFEELIWGSIPPRYDRETDGRYELAEVEDVLDEIVAEVIGIAIDEVEIFGESDNEEDDRLDINNKPTDEIDEKVGEAEEDEGDEGDEEDEDRHELLGVDNLPFTGF